MHVDKTLRTPCSNPVYITQPIIILSVDWMHVMLIKFSARLVYYIAYNYTHCGLDACLFKTDVYYIAYNYTHCGLDACLFKTDVYYIAYNYTHCGLDACLFKTDVYYIAYNYTHCGLDACLFKTAK